MEFIILSQKPKIHSITSLVKTRCFHIEQLELTFSNQENRTYERLVGSDQGAVLVVPMLDDDTVLMVYEYCGGTDRYELGCVKGKIDAGETAIQTAARELTEEIGYQANTLELLKTVTLAPGYQSNFTHIVLARGLTFVGISDTGDEPEPLVVVKKSLSNLSDWVYDKDLTEGRTLAALYLTKDFLQNAVAPLKKLD